MKLLMCSCRSCKAGRKYHRIMINNKKGNHRREVKIKLRQGDYDGIVNKILIGYTD